VGCSEANKTAEKKKIVPKPDGQKIYLLQNKKKLF